jgi:HPt (histidine-containing phosphotransfer) domain-containing protein
LIAVFNEDAPQLIEAMRRALETGNADLFRRSAHTLKSNAANFGALALAAQAKALETRGQSGALEGAAEPVALVATEYERVRQRLSELAP